METSRGELSFFGNKTAELFSLAIKKSLAGVLENNFQYGPDENIRGFVSASVEGRPWHNTMWSRDAGVFLRELAQWGYFEHAVLLAQNLIRLVRKNKDGYYTFPMYFKYGEPGCGSELDGTGAIVIALVLLWKRLPEKSEAKRLIYDFLFSEASPLSYILNMLDKYPLIPGSGEFGGGMDVDGEYFNAVQNFLVYCALASAESMAEYAQNKESAELLRNKEALLLSNIEKYFIGSDRSWIWCIDPATMKADPDVLNFRTNKGFAGINGISAMYSDVFGFDPLGSQWKYADICKNTFDVLLSNPQRRCQYEKYGIFTQFEELHGGYLSSPSYGQGYAIQHTLLYDLSNLYEKLIGFLVNSTFDVPEGYHLDRKYDYYFYERIMSPDFFAQSPNPAEKFDQGCGALNLVNVCEPLKIARLIAGVDDSDKNILKIIPRLPDGWIGFELKNWPVLTGMSLIRADILLEKDYDRYNFKLQFNDPVPRLEIVLNLPDGKLSRYPFENVRNTTLRIQL